MPKPGHRPKSKDSEQPCREMPGRFDAVRMRLLQCLESYSYAEISNDTGIDEETVRKSLTTDQPSQDLIKAVCDVYMIDADWLVCGRKEGLPITQVKGSAREDLLPPQEKRESEDPTQNKNI